MNEIPDTPWTQLDKLVADYVDSYELRADEGDYQPNDFEQALIMDAIQGLLGDDEITRKLIEATEYTRARRREASQCEDCGHNLPGHWGGCRTQTVSGEPHG